MKPPSEPTRSATALVLNGLAAAAAGLLLVKLGQKALPAALAMPPLLLPGRRPPDRAARSRI